MSPRKLPSPERLDAQRAEYQPDIEYRRVVLWPEGGRTVSEPLSKADAEHSYAASCGGIPKSMGATVLLESRYVEGWEVERKAVLGRSEVAPATAAPVQEELFAC